MSNERWCCARCYGDEPCDGSCECHQWCSVYWGSHGCSLRRGHDGTCVCDCCRCGEHHPYPEWPDTDVVCVAKSPYYGPDTTFYGGDVETRGLPRLVEGGQQAP